MEIPGNAGWKISPLKGMKAGLLKTAPTQGKFPAWGSLLWARHKIFSASGFRKWGPLTKFKGR